MRLLHPMTLEIIATKMKDDEFKYSTSSRKQIVSHSWSEVLKYLATNQTHPKMFLNEECLGYYMRVVYNYGNIIGCNFNEQHLIKYDEVWYYYISCGMWESHLRNLKEFDKNYLFSDAVSLYLKGCNIFPYIFGDEWTKYCPIISLEEIQRVVTKAVDKKKSIICGTRKDLL